MLNTNYSNGNIIILSKKSFIVYIPYIISFILMVITGFGKSILVTLFLIIPFGIGVFLHIKSITLFVDENGVWVYEGILPWNRGYYGIRWVDFEEGLFYPNIVSYFTKSYTIELRHKYKNDSNITLTQMHNGDIAITKINEIYNDFIKFSRYRY